MTVSRLAVIGAGTMGHGIAQVFAQSGSQVALTDSSAQVLDNATQRIRANLETCFGHSPASADGDGIEATLGRVSVQPDLAEAVSQADFVVEAVFEDLGVKHEVLCQIEEYCQTQAIITSTTSSYRVRDLAVALAHPERFLAVHFWNPPYIIPVVEVMPGDGTSDHATETTIALLEKAGKVPVLVNKDVPGYIGNRLQHALRREAIALVAENIASPEDVDIITRLSFGLRMPMLGPLETVDLGGLDLTQAIQTFLLPELDRSAGPAQLIHDKVARGELGAKSGRGFYEWPPEHRASVIQQRDRALLEIMDWLDSRGLLGRPASRASPEVSEHDTGKGSSE